jgi:hypothetical protein
MSEDFEDINHKSFIRERNRRLHYQKAVFERIERQNRRRRLYLLFALLPLVAAMTSFSLILIEENKFIEKFVLQKDIETIISNGGDLGAIKQAL